MHVAVADNPPFVLYFRVKFYVSEPSKLKEEYTRYVTDIYPSSLIFVRLFLHLTLLQSSCVYYKPEL